MVASPASSHNALTSQIARARNLIANGQEANAKLFRNTFGFNKPVPAAATTNGGFGKVTGTALHNLECPRAQPQPTAARYLPNGASSVGGAHRMAQARAALAPSTMSPTLDAKAQQLMIIEEGETDKLLAVTTTEQARELYLKSMERRLNLQQEEIQRRQQVIERLERELLREKRFKHTEHICENCNEPCILQKEPQREHPVVASQQFNFKKLNNAASGTLNPDGQGQSSRYTPKPINQSTQQAAKLRQLKQSSPLFRNQAAEIVQTGKD